MVSIKHRGGFTLVEITIVMAITTALVAAAFIGQATIRAKYTFTTGLERIKSSIQQVKTEAYSTQYVSSGSGTGTKAFFGKAILFDRANPTVMSVLTILKDLNTEDPDATTTNLTTTPDYTLTVPNGLSISSVLIPSGPTKVCIVFAQSNIAEPKGYAVADCSPSQLAAFSNYNPSATSVRIKFQDAGDDNDGWVEITTKNLTISSLVTK